VEFDPFGCSVKDLPTRSEIVRCNSTGQLYPLLPSASALLASSSSSLWHQRLGHPGPEALSKLTHSATIKCTTSTPDGLCHACQLGRHTRLPFHVSSSCTSHMFQLLHCDLWTLPITSVSGHKYYLVILDDYSHYLWTFPLRLKSDTFSTLSNFFTYVHTQFGVPIQGLQSDNGREFDNLSARSFFASLGVLFRMSCPYTSAQNGKAERIIRTTNNVVRSLLFHASVPPSLWVPALAMATHLLNILPTKTLSFSTPPLCSFWCPSLL
jgi:histone deacetylase 1/2